MARSKIERLQLASPAVALGVTLSGSAANTPTRQTSGRSAHAGGASYSRRSSSSTRAKESPRYSALSRCNHGPGSPNGSWRWSPSTAERAAANRAGSRPREACRKRCSGAERTAWSVPSTIPGESTTSGGATRSPGATSSIELEGGRRLTVYHDLVRDAWYEQGYQEAREDAAPVEPQAPETAGTSRRDGNGTTRQSSNPKSSPTTSKSSPRPSSKAA